MSRMDGLELMVIGRKRHFELQWEGGGYVDRRGRPITGLLDMTCYSCGAGYYTLEEEAIAFCPACGFIERDAPKSWAEMAEWARNQDWSYLEKVGKWPFGVNGARGWALKFAKDANELLRSGQYGEVRRLWPPSGDRR